MTTIDLGDLTIDTTRIPIWDAGVRGGIPSLAINVNIMDYGAVADGSTDDTTALNNALAAATGTGVVYLPPGRYAISGRITMASDRVIRGAGPDQTKILATPSGGNHTFYVTGSRGSDVAITANASIGDTTITVASAAGLSIGDTIGLQVDDDPAWGIGVATVGQTAQIAGISGNVLTLDTPLRLDYPTSRNPMIFEITPRTGIGFESFSVEHVSSDSNQSFMFRFRYVTNSWIYNVESYNTAKHHINIENSRWLTVTGCDIHQAYSYAGGGFGYGISLQTSTSDCLVENNTLHSLRHSIVTGNASGCVIAYNYSTADHGLDGSSEVAGYTDLLVHGDYGHNLLIEGNVCRRIECADFWGPAPRNTIFRNRVTKAGNAKPGTVYRAGLIIASTGDGSNDCNVLANTVRATINNTSYSGGAVATGGWFEQNIIRDDGWSGSYTGNTRTGNILSWTTADEWSLPASLYYLSPPSWWASGLTWPSVGADIDSSRGESGLQFLKIPAQIRFEQKYGLIIDNQDDGFSTSGDWTESLSTSLNHHGQQHFYSSVGSGTDIATWSFAVQEAGDYRVSAWWTDSGVRPTDAEYNVTHADGSTVIQVDQSVNGGQFNHLGVFTFEANTTYAVTISDNGDTGDVVADALRFVSLIPGGGSNAVYRADANLRLLCLIDDPNNIGADSSPAGNDLSSGGAPAQSLDVPTVRYASSVDLETSNNDYLYISDASQSGLDITGDISVGAWINLESLTGSRTILAKQNETGNDRAYMFWVTSGGLLRLTLSSNGTNTVTAEADLSLATGLWYHVAGVYNGVDVRLYINAVLDSNGSDNPLTYSGGINNSAADFRVGRRMDSGFNYDGLITEAFVFSRSLSPGEISSIFQYGIQPAIAGSNPALLALANLGRKLIQ